MHASLSSLFLELDNCILTTTVTLEYTFFIETRFLKSLFITGAGKVFVVTEEVTASKEIVQLHFAAKDLDKKDFFGKSDPFMVISRTSPMHSGNNFSLPQFRYYSITITILNINYYLCV